MHLVELFVKLIELRGLRHDVLVHHERRLDFSVSPLVQEVEPVRNESLIEVDTIIREEVSTMTGDLGPCKNCQERYRGWAGDAEVHPVRGPLHLV
jgi:hypothetical protein